VLQEGEIDRIGAKGPVNVDVRVIAATNRDLGQAVHDKTFREDLYYRLNVFPIRLPPLRERREDIPLLASYFATRFAARLGKVIDGIDSMTMDRLTAYAWPGNIRELENIMERSVILSPGRVLDVAPEMLPTVTVHTVISSVPQSAIDLESVEREHILTVLNHTNWVVEGARGAAPILGLHPNTLRSRMKKLGIRRPTHKLS
jgi:transcriptional regulator with GAF, ATPase, and Fis domain